MTDLDKLPRLRAGQGATPAHGGCLVQIANWLCDHDLWTDRPIHVNRVLASAGIQVNDNVGEDARRVLAVAAARIAGTSAILDAFVSVHLQHWININPPPRPGQPLVDWYFTLIDEYDRMTGHKPSVVPDEEWAELAMLMTEAGERPHEQEALQELKEMLDQLKLVQPSFNKMLVALHVVQPSFSEVVDQLTLVQIDA